MRSDLRLPFVLLLLIATAAAFAFAQRLKLQRTPVAAVTVTKLFSPVCRCQTAGAEVRFRLRKPDRVTILIADDTGRAVRHLVDRVRVGRTRTRFAWDGRDDEGRVVADGDYQPRLHLLRGGQTFDLPNRIKVDTKPPRLRVVAAPPPTISPDGDGRADRLTIRYRVDEPSETWLSVDGTLRIRVRGLQLQQKISWSGRIDGRVRPGRQRLVVFARDRAGNLSRASEAITLRIRFVALPRHVIRVRAGSRFDVDVDTDAQIAAWRLGPRRGMGPAHPLRLRAPARAGRYVLRVSAAGHAARATVRVARG